MVRSNASDHKLRLRPLAAAAALGVAVLLSGCNSSSNDGKSPTGPIASVTPVEGISVANGTALEEVLAQLPETTTILLASGKSLTVPLTWRLTKQVQGTRGRLVMKQIYYPAARGDYLFTGSFDLPDGVTQPEPPVPQEVTATVTVLGGALLSITDRADFAQPGTYKSATLQLPRDDQPPAERTFEYYVPSSYDASTPLPLMFTFHGAGSYGAGQLYYSQFDRVAEQKGFIVVAPDHGLSAKGLFDLNSTPAFTAAIIDYFVENYAIDQQRIYASGISMGGLASQSVALALPNRIAAIASVAMNLNLLLQNDLPKPTTVVAFYGTEDNDYPGNFYNAIYHLVEQNGTSWNPTITRWEATENDITSITRYVYSGGTNGTEVAFYRIENGGHTWPGKYQYASLMTVGLTSQHIDATERIWEHLSQHRLAAPGGS